jgi:plasmid maintenance system killer protein
MAEVRLTPKFVKALQKLGHKQMERAKKSLLQFQANPRHPSLHFEKLSGSPYCTIRVDMNHRIVVRDEGDDRYEMVDIGNHDYVDRAYG